MPTEAGHDPANHSGFTEAHLEVLERFRDVAVDNHLQNGNLDGSGSTPKVNHHVKGVVSAQQLLNHFDLPVVMSVPTGISDSPRTVGSNDTGYGFSVAAWVSDYDQAYGLEQAQIIIGNVVNNIEQNRELAKPDGSDPIARDTSLDGSDAVTFDFALNITENAHLKYGTADFRVETKRRKP